MMLARIIVVLMGHIQEESAKDDIIFVGENGGPF